MEKTWREVHRDKCGKRSREFEKEEDLRRKGKGRNNQERSGDVDGRDRTGRRGGERD